MKPSLSPILAACLAGSLCVMPLQAEEPQAMPKGEAVIATTQATAIVAKIDYQTRVLILKGEDGRQQEFVVDETVKNLPEVTVGDTITLTYTEALAYQVKKGGQADASAQPGERPAGAVGKDVIVTVEIIAIDREAPSVTIRKPSGETQTIKIQHPEKLVGVSVGDTADITYTEALAIKVEKRPTK